MGACQVHLAYYTAGQVNRNKHFVKTLLHLEDIFFDGLTILVNELNIEKTENERCNQCCEGGGPCKKTSTDPSSCLASVQSL